MDILLDDEWVSSIPNTFPFEMAQKRTHCAGGITEFKGTEGQLKPCKKWGHMRKS